MSTKIVEKIMEPAKIETGSLFKIKINAIRYCTYNELQKETYEKVKDFSYSDLKGD